MINIVLCGGNGTRLWPISRTLMPKQFIKFFEEQSLFQLTLKRNAKICDSQYIVSSQEQYFLAFEQLSQINIKNVKYVLEPIGRNTAPAIALTCFSLPKDAVVLVTPSEHLIKNEIEYINVVQKAKELACKDFLVTFGITPQSPEIGFGYIESDGENVKAFHEKPDIIKAKSYLKAGNYYWNSGMFCFKVGVFLEELQKYAPEIYNKSLIAYQNSFKSELCRIYEEDMISIPDDSIDYAVMEKSSIVKVIPSNIDWSDLGSFDALYEELPKDNSGNTQNKNYIGIESKNNLIYGNEKKIATIDVDDLIIVDTGDALLISKKGSSQKVKQVVEKIKEDTDLHNIHLTVHRPWGTYTVLEEGDNYKIKRLEVIQGKRLSLQKHLHRNEHWIVVSGTATVTIDNEVKTLRENESTYIRMGQLHRLENQGKIPIIIIEVQVGSYLGEDDIIRLEDDFKRK